MHHVDHSAARAAAARAQVWAFPLVMAQRLRLNFTQPADPFAVRPATSAGAALDHLGHQRALSDPDLRVGVAPNVDTLYSVAWLDLDGGDHVLHAPDFGERYYSVQVGLADTGSPWAFGQRTHGPQLPTLRFRRGALGTREVDGQLEVSTPHRYLMLCLRVLVEPDDPADLGAVHALQDQVRVSAPAPRVPASTSGAPGDLELAAVPRDAELREPSAFARSVARVLQDLSPDAVPDQVHDDLATAALLPVATVGDPDHEAAVRSGLADGLTAVAGRVATLGRQVDGWALNDRGPDVGDDLLLRAAVAMSQIFINPAEEALYPVAEVDDQGEPLDGARGEYTVRFPAGEPPVGAFWSLTVYHRAGFLVANPAGRHAVGDRTPGLRFEADGSLVVRVAAEPPAAGGGNWLPAPHGPFRLVLRLYAPARRGWVPPPVRRVA